MCELILYSPEKTQKKQTQKQEKLKSAKFLYIQFISNLYPIYIQFISNLYPIYIQFIYIISYQIIYIYHLYYSWLFTIRFESTSP